MCFRHIFAAIQTLITLFDAMEVIVFEKESYYKMLGEFAKIVKENTKAEQNQELWVDRDEAMKILSCKKSKLQQLRDTAEIEFSRSGRTIMYHKPSLLAYWKKHQQ